MELSRINCHVDVKNRELLLLSWNVSLRTTAVSVLDCQCDISGPLSRPQIVFVSDDRITKILCSIYTKIQFINIGNIGNILLLHTCTIGRKLGNYPFKLLHMILPTKSLLQKMTGAKG